MGIMLVALKSASRITRIDDKDCYYRKLIPEAVIGLACNSISKLVELVVDEVTDIVT